MKVLVLAFTVLTAFVSSASQVSALETTAYFDSHSILRPCVGDVATVAYAGAWFASGTCQLFVDGVLVGTSDGAIKTYRIVGDPQASQTHTLTLKSGDTEINRVVTIYPSEDYVGRTHTVVLENNMLDSHPAGTLRRVRYDETASIAYSTFWNAATTGATVKLYRGDSASGEPISVLIEKEADCEGAFRLTAKTMKLAPGRYTLTHADGVETLVAHLDVRGAGLLVIFR